MTGPHKTAPILALSLVLAGSVTAARAEDGAMAATRDPRLEMAFGSTIVSTYPDGRQAELWLKRDGAYEAEGRRHDRSGGTWQIKTDGKAQKLCLKQRRPFPTPFSFCTPVPEAGLERPWTGKAYTGEQISIRLVRGTFDPAKNDQQDGPRKAQARRDDDNG
ncbi:MAG: hypothetical protein ACXU82_12995 [Caulobacteraceae bacterium]